MDVYEKKAIIILHHTEQKLKYKKVNLKMRHIYARIFMKKINEN